MHLTLKYSLLIFLYLINLKVVAQNPQSNENGIRLMFYNVENLFHPDDDTLKRDDQFTAEGTKHWTYGRYRKKLNNIAQNIIAVGEWEPPAIVGLCEIENLQCLKDLLNLTPLKSFGYEIIHQESKDQRGIDVAIIYRPEFFRLHYQESIELIFPENHHPTRDILYIKGTVDSDTLHCFVNHWTSRYGGQSETAPKRNYSAQVLKSKFDSIQTLDHNANIIALGDFNDYPTDHSILNVLGAKKDTSNLKETDLINLTSQFENGIGTNKYQHQWHVLDQCIINQNLLNNQYGLYTGFSFTKIFSPEWLLTDESDGFGRKPFRTYNGFKYIGGYSDHLPIYVDVYKTKKE